MGSVCALALVYVVKMDCYLLSGHAFRFRSTGSSDSHVAARSAAAVDDAAAVVVCDLPLFHAIDFAGDRIVVKLCKE